MSNLQTEEKLRLLQEEFDKHLLIDNIEEEDEEEEEARAELRKLDKLRATQKNASLRQSRDNLSATRELPQNKDQFVKNPKFSDAERQQLRKIFDTYRSFR